MSDRIKELAEQAGWSGLYTTYNEPTGEENWEMVKESITVPVTAKHIERFAELVRQDEREACARLCEEYADDKWNLYKGRSPYTGKENGRADPHVQGENCGAIDCAAAIRARGDKHD